MRTIKLLLFTTICIAFFLEIKAQSNYAIIKGVVGYPDDELSPTIIVVAKNVETGEEIETKKGDIVWIGFKYSLKVPSGSYSVFIKTPEYRDYPKPDSYYTEFVRCGETEACSSHKVAIVKADKGRIITGIHPRDHYFKPLSENEIAAYNNKNIEKETKVDAKPTVLAGSTNPKITIDSFLGKWQGNLTYIKNSTSESTVVSDVPISFSFEKFKSQTVVTLLYEFDKWADDKTAIYKEPFSMELKLENDSTIILPFSSNKISSNEQPCQGNMRLSLEYNTQFQGVDLTGEFNTLEKGCYKVNFFAFKDGTIYWQPRQQNYIIVNGTKQATLSKEDVNRLSIATNKQSSQNQYSNAEQGLKAGDIADNVQKIEADEVYPFFGNFAIIRTNQSQALINDKGEIIFPYNKYVYENKKNEIYPKNIGALAGGTGINPIKLIPVSKPFIGYIDMSGKPVVSISNSFDREGYFFDYYGSKDFVDYKNNRIVVSKNALPDWMRTAAKIDKSSSSSETFTNGLMATNSTNGKIGYIDRTGLFKIAPQFDAAGEFSNEIAFVAKNDEFKELKWGAIDNKGKQIIPFKYSLQPSRFTNNRSLIKLLNQEHSNYAFINKTGNIVFTLPKDIGDTVAIHSYNEFYRGGWLEDVPNGPEPFLFNEGYTYVSIEKLHPSKNDIYDVYLLDTNGHYTPIIELLRKKIPEGQISIKSGIKNGTFIFELFNNRSGPNSTLGLANVKGNILIAPVFNTLHFFEKESMLQYAELTSVKDKKTITTKGYIDRNGIFRIIQVDRKPNY